MPFGAFLHRKENILPNIDHLGEPRTPLRGALGGAPRHADAVPPTSRVVGRPLSYRLEAVEASRNPAFDGRGGR
jgi:hypothetical protein